MDFSEQIRYKQTIMELAKQLQYLKENGFTEQQAHAFIFVQKSIIDSELATKKDILLLQKDIEGLKKDIEQLRADTKKDIEGLKKDIEQLRADTKKDIEGLKKDIVIQLGSIVVAGVVVLGVLMSILN